MYTPSTDYFIHQEGVYTSSVNFFSSGEAFTLCPRIIYPLRRGVHFLRGFFIHWKGVYTSSLDHLSTGEGCTLPPWIIYPLGTGVHSPGG